MKKGVLKLLLMGISYTFIGFLFQLLFINLLWASESKGQGTKDIKEVIVNVEIQDKTLKETFKILEDLSPFNFVYDKKDKFLAHKFNIERQTISIEDILVKIATDSRLQFKQINNNISVGKHSPQKKELDDNAPADIMISGKVTDSAGAPIPGVTITVGGTTNGTVTNLEGEYTLTVPEGATLRFSFIGFLTQSIEVGDQSIINVNLMEDIASLDEVVVVGYGTQKKINLTGAIDVVQGEQLENRPVMNVSSALQGVSPNLNVTSSSFGGEPGAGSNLNIRGIGSLTGNSQPYVLVDGTPMDINNVNPNDIESISVLKDAAASAIYGARAPYGVILITTKQGGKDEKISISYNNNIAFNSPLNLPHMMNSLDFATAVNQAASNTGRANFITDETIERIIDYQAGRITDEAIVDPNNPNRWQGGYGTNGNNDWPHIFFAENVLSQKHDINVKGGGKTTSYYVSAGYLNQPGTLEMGDEYYKRYNITANLKTEVTDWMRFNISTKYTKSSFQFPNAAWAKGSDKNFNYERFLHSVWPALYRNFPDGQQNTVLIGFEEGGREKISNDDLWLTLGTEIEPIEGWITRLNYNWNPSYSYSSKVDKPTYQYTIDKSASYPVGFPFSKVFQSMSRSQFHLFNITSTYSKKVNDHFFSTLIGYEEQLSEFNLISGDKADLVTPDVPSFSTATGQYNLEDELWHSSTQGIYGRVNYNYKEKYLLEFNARYDGSSRFAEDSRWGFFPSASAGYNISRENFWLPLSDLIGEFKVRASYGSLGNQNVPNYLYDEILSINTNLPWIIGDQRPVYAQTPNLVSPSLTWETATITNIGTDLAFLNNRLGLTLDWYNRKTSNMFGPAETLPSVLGALAPQTNNAEINTKGMELTITWNQVISNDFSYNAKFLLSNSVTTINKYNNKTNLIDNWYEGQTIGERWGFETLGLVQDQADLDNMADQSAIDTRWSLGDIMYKDLDGDGKITIGNSTLDNPGDRVIIGNERPRFNYSALMGFNWKWLDFNMFWQGVMAQDVFFGEGDHTFFGFMGNPWDNSYFPQHLNYWRPSNEDNIFGPNTNAYYPKPYSDWQNLKNHQVQSRYVQSAAYLRLKNIQLGFTIPQALSDKISISKLRVYASAENLITFTELSELFDPETVNGIAGPGKTHPLTKSLSFGINLTF